LTVEEKGLNLFKKLLNFIHKFFTVQINKAIKIGVEKLQHEIK